MSPYYGNDFYGLVIYVYNKSSPVQLLRENDEIHAHRVCIHYYTSHARSDFFLPSRSVRSPLPNPSDPPSPKHHVYTYIIICIRIYIFRSPKSRRRFILIPFRPRPERPRSSYPIRMYVHGCTYIYNILVVSIVSYNFNTCRRLKVIADSISHCFFSCRRKWYFVILYINTIYTRWTLLM